MHPCTGRSAASPIPVRPRVTAGRAKGPMPTSPRQARARTGTSGHGCAVTAAPRASGHPAAPISRRLPAQSERTVVGSTLPCQSRVAAAPTADRASCLGVPGRTGPGHGRSIHPLQETDRRPLSVTGHQRHARTESQAGHQPAGQKTTPAGLTLPAATRPAGPGRTTPGRSPRLADTRSSHRAFPARLSWYPSDAPPPDRFPSGVRKHPPRPACPGRIAFGVDWAQNPVPKSGRGTGASTCCW
jgi:hypothetical protein